MYADTTLKRRLLLPQRSPRPNADLLVRADAIMWRCSKRLKNRAGDSFPPSLHSSQHPTTPPHLSFPRTPTQLTLHHPTPRHHARPQTHAR